MWNTADELVGQRVEIYTSQGDSEIAVVLAVSDRTSNIKVRSEDGAVLIGNQWEALD